MPFDMMGGYVLAIAFDLVPESRKKEHGRASDSQDRRKRGLP